MDIVIDTVRLVSNQVLWIGVFEWECYVMMDPLDYDCPNMISIYAEPAVLTIRAHCRLYVPS